MNLPVLWDWGPALPVTCVPFYQTTEVSGCSLRSPSPPGLSSPSSREESQSPTAESCPGPWFEYWSSQNANTLRLLESVTCAYNNDILLFGPLLASSCGNKSIYWHLLVIWSITTSSDHSNNNKNNDNNNKKNNVVVKMNLNIFAYFTKYFIK